MKLPALCAGLAIAFALGARADLTLVEKIEGVGPVSDLTIKIKGDLARIDSSPQVTAIMNLKTGDVISLMNDQKVAVRMSGEKMKAAKEMMNKFSDQEKTEDTAKAIKLQPSGKKEKINGYDTELYTQDAPNFKATYWIATNYPNAASIMKQLQTLSSEFVKKNAKMPDYRDFPGLPLKIEFTGGDPDKKMTTTIVSAKEDSLSDAEFAVPADYKEMQTPDLKQLLGGKGRAPAGQASPRQP